MKTFINEKITLRKLALSDVNDLLKAGFLYKHVLDQALCNTLGNRIRRKIGLMPHSTGLVAYDDNGKHAIGFLSLTNHTSSIYSIKFVFTDPKFRRSGVATGLLKYAESLAAQCGAKKVYLNANSSDNSLVDFYTKRGFTLISDNSMLWGGGSPTKLSFESKAQLALSEAKSKISKQNVFSIYKECMGHDWVNFFDVTKKNLTNGFLQSYRSRLFSKYAFSDDSANLVVLLSKIPLLSSGFVELYAPSDSDVSYVLDDLSKILIVRGLKYMIITVFNISNNEFFDLLNRKGFYPFQARVLGKFL